MGNPYDITAPQFEEYKVRCAKEGALQNYLATSDVLEDILNADDESIQVKLTQFIILKNKGEDEQADLMFDDFINALSKEQNDFETEALQALYIERQEALEADREFWQENPRPLG